MSEKNKNQNSGADWSDVLESIISRSPVAAYIAQHGEFKFINERFMNDFSGKRDEKTGQYPKISIHPDDFAVTRENAIAMLKGERMEPYNYRIIKDDGSIHWIRESVVSVQYKGERAAWGFYEDITDRKLQEDHLVEQKAALEKLVSDRTREMDRQARMLEAQEKELLEVSSPVMQIWKGVLVAPLIGNLDTNRTSLFMEKLLNRIVDSASPVVLIDITGVPSIDTETAQNVIDTINAVRLLGAQVILTGISPAIAQTLVHLGIDLSGVTTRSALSDGLLVALKNLDLSIS